nr:MAG TPA: hypothetical protein [Caudoviricetes sp.]DAP75949.1 MAG TPA: hypothetical protein [Caudoviricetes sp.]
MIRCHYAAVVLHSRLLSLLFIYHRVSHGWHSLNYCIQ